MRTYFLTLKIHACLIFSTLILQYIINIIESPALRYCTPKNMFHLIMRKFLFGCHTQIDKEVEKNQTNIQVTIKRQTTTTPKQY